MRPEFEYRFITRKRGEKFQLILNFKDAHGKWHQRSRTFAKAADTRSSIYRQNMLKEAAEGLSVNVAYKDITLNEFAAFYATQRTDLAVSTHLAYTERMRMIPKLAKMKIRDITYIDIAAQFAALTFSQRTIDALLSTIRALFKAAVKYHIIAASPAADFEYKSKKQKKDSRPRTFTAEEMDALDAHIGNPEIKIILAICRYTGCRIGEALGITWQDIDIMQQTIQINKQYGIIGAAGNRKLYGMKPVKNANGNRTVYITPALLQHLAAYRKVAPLYIDGRLTAIKNTGHVNVYIRYHAKGHSIHDYRHTFATTLLNQNVNIRTIAALLGDTVVTVERVYLDFTAEMRENARALLKDIKL
jgi:integrase